MSTGQAVVYDGMGEKQDTTPFGVKLREMRRKKKLSQFQLAIKMGKTPSKVAQYESGVRNPTRVSIAELVDLLDLSPAEHDELLMAAGFMPESRREMVEAIIRDLPPVDDMTAQEEDELMSMVKGFCAARNPSTRRSIAQAAKRIIEEEERERKEAEEK